MRVHVYKGVPERVCAANAFQPLGQLCLSLD